MIPVKRDKLIIYAYRHALKIIMGFPDSIIHHRNPSLAFRSRFLCGFQCGGIRYPVGFRFGYPHDIVHVAAI